MVNIHLHKCIPIGAGLGGGSSDAISTLLLLNEMFQLAISKQELEQLAGYGKKSIDNLFASIENSKKNSLEKLLFGLGIKQVGSKTAKILSQQYKTLTNLTKATYEELTSKIKTAQLQL